MIKKLKNIPLFSAFSEEELQELVPLVEAENYKAGEVIIREGDEGKAMYIIEKGFVEIEKQGRTLDWFSDGDIFGEMAFFDKSVRSASTIARKDTAILKINNQDLKRIIVKYPSSGVHFLFRNTQEMSRRLRQTSRYFVAVFETGKIIGSGCGLKEMTEKILDREY